MHTSHRLDNHQRRDDRRDRDVGIERHDHPPRVEGDHLQQRIGRSGQARTHVHDVVDEAEEDVVNDCERRQHPDPNGRGIAERQAASSVGIGPAAEQPSHENRKSALGGCAKYFSRR